VEIIKIVDYVPLFISYPLKIAKKYSSGEWVSNFSHINIWLNLDFPEIAYFSLNYVIPIYC
jgi:hypothetical protein